MLTSSVLLLLSLYFVQVATGQSYIDGFRSTGDCFKNFPSLSKRFSWEQLEFFCQQKRAYDEIIYVNGSLTVSAYFTSGQINYLDSLKLKLDPTTVDNPPSIAIRKEIRQLSGGELRDFLWALRKLKFSRIDGVSKYDLLVMLSHPALAPGAHVGAAFLPWHREYLRMFESALRKEEPQASLPYWDSTLEEGLPNPIDSVIWSDFLFGSVKGAVVTGVAKFWYFAGFNQSESSVLNRNVSQEGMPVSPTLVQFFLSRKKLRELTACVDLTVEQTSRSLHEYVGGTMRNIYYSPQDFLFFLHHAYLDYLWEKFRMTRQTAEERQSDYPSNYESCTKFHYGSAYMRPFPKLKNIDGLNEVYTSRYYKYHDSPTCNSSCESPYLFCDKSNSRCLSKIRPGGNCSGLAISSDTVCFNSHCIKGVCLFTNSTTTSSASDKNETLPTEASLQVFKIKTKELMAHHKLKAIQNGKFKIHYLRH